MVAGRTAVPSFAALAFALPAVLSAASVSCSGDATPGGAGTLVAALTGSALRDEMRSMRVVVFDLTAQGCTGHRVANPGLAPLATSGLVRSAALQATLEVPAGPRTIYVEVYRDDDGTDRFGTGCVELVLAAGERATVRIEIELLGASDADADADADGDADAEDAGEVDAADVDAGDVEGGDGDAEDVAGPDVVVDGPDGVVDGETGEGIDAWDAPADEPADEPDDGDAAEDGTEEDAAPPSAVIVISEIDYDQDRTDNLEFVELYNAGASTVSCAGLELQFINGVGPSRYRTQTLTCSSLAPGAFHVVGSSALLASIPACPSMQILGSGGTSLIENGPATTTDGDAVALVDGSSGSPVVLDQVAYEGPVVGWGEGSPAPTDDATGESLQRIPPGRDRNENSIDFTVWPPTPCAAP